MEAKGLIRGKDGLVSSICFSIIIMGLLIRFVLEQDTFFYIVFLSVVMLIGIYLVIFSSTKYCIDERGVFVKSCLSKYNRSFRWSEIRKIEQKHLTQGDMNQIRWWEYYIISTTNDSKTEKDLWGNMKRNKVICVPVTKNTTACLAHYAVKYGIAIATPNGIIQFDDC